MYYFEKKFAIYKYDFFNIMKMVKIGENYVGLL